MNTKPKIYISILLAVTILLVNFGGMTGIAYAEDDPPVPVLEVEVFPVIIECGDVEYTISWENGSPPYLIFMDYGDGDASGLPLEVNSNSTILTHPYTDHGDYEWTVRVEEKVEEELEGLGGSAVGIITIDGPAVTLNSTPFPPVIVLGDTVEFSATVTGGAPEYVYAWNLGDGIGTGDTAALPPYTYTAVGKYQAEVMVTDSCEFVSTATLPVVVADPGDVCHPTAQKIADGVNTLFPNQAGDLYSCEDIYDMFNGSLTGDQLGFGRMWKAYNLAQTMEELTWEEIRDWHLDAGGWGALLQLDRFSDLLEEHSIGDLMALVMSEEFSLGDVRIAVRSVTRYEADFEDALSRIAEGANPGELGQLYKLAADLEVDPTILDEYLAAGLTLSELKHTANFAARMEVDWTEIAEFRASADSWGDIKQAYNLATDEISAAQILILGIQEYRKDLQEADKEGRAEQQAAQKAARNLETAEKLAERFSANSGDVMDLLNGKCEGNWGCVRKALRDQESTMSGEPTDKDIQTALQIASKYGYSQGEVLDYNNDFCSGDWACTRTYFRENSLIIKETGKPNK
ncbi:MAG: PKD domain-containing protein [Anaerolineales bacterium]|nr:PKD domain-containing protein [Anaerolineales bacterium]